MFLFLGFLAIGVGFSGIETGTMNRCWGEAARVDESGGLEKMALTTTICLDDFLLVLVPRERRAVFAGSSCKGSRVVTFLVIIVDISSCVYCNCSAVYFTSGKFERCLNSFFKSPVKRRPLR